MRILIIDDDPDLRSLLAHYIKQHWPAWTVDEYDPLERNFPAADFPLGSYQALILDYMLGRGDGLEWLQRLKSQPTVRRSCSSPAPATRSSRCAR